MAEGDKHQLKQMEILKKKPAEETFISDAQLLRIIRETENMGLIAAPHYLKENIMKESRSLQTAVSVNKNKMSADLQLFLYGLKITAAMAGAIFMIMVMNPNISYSQRLFQERRVPDRKVTEVLYNYSNAVSGALNEFSHKLIDWR